MLGKAGNRSDETIYNLEASRGRHRCRAKKDCQAHCRGYHIYAGETEEE